MVKQPILLSTSQAKASPHVFHTVTTNHHSKSSNSQSGPQGHHQFSWCHREMITMLPTLVFNCPAFLGSWWPWTFPQGQLLFCLQVITIIPAIKASYDPGRVGFILRESCGKNQRRLVDMLLHLVQPQDPGDKSGHNAQFFGERLWHALKPIPITLQSSWIIRCQLSLMSTGSPQHFEELCRQRASVVIANWCLTTPELLMPYKYLSPTKRLPNKHSESAGFLLQCAWDSYKSWCKLAALFFYINL